MKINGFRARHYIAALFLLALPAVVQAQFTYTTNNGAITITGYNGTGGAVVIPDATNGYAVIGIGDFAFEDGTNLLSVTIPSSITNIGVGPFLGCTSLTNISVDTGNQWYGSSRGVLFEDTRQPVLVAYPAGLTNGTYTIEPGLSIADYAFADCSSLTNMTVNVAGIGDYAFIGCTGLTDVNIGGNPYSAGSESFPLINVGEATFTGCTSLSTVFIASTVTNIEGMAFAFCTNLTVAYFEGNAPSNDGTAFSGDPDAVVYYESGTTGWGTTFGGAPTVGEMPPIDFEVEFIDGSMTIKEYEGPNGAVMIPAYIDGYPVTSIGNVAFEDDLNITSVTIPNTVTDIGQEAFLFCTSLTNVVIPDSITSIGEEAFFGCSSLANIVIPSSVTSIGGYGGYGEDAFEGCASLTSISVDSANPEYSSLSGVLFDKAQDTLIVYPEGLTNSTYTIPNSVTSISEGAFSDCTNLFIVSVPDTVTNIGDFAFYGCTGLINIVLPGSVASIGQQAFCFIPSLTSAYFEGNAPPDVSGTAFAEDPNAIVFYLPGTTGWGATFGSAPTELWNPQAIAFSTAGNQFGFNITGPTNTTIVVEACTNLANPVWLPISTNTLSGGESSFSDPQRANYPNRYYRFSAP